MLNATVVPYETAVEMQMQLSGNDSLDLGPSMLFSGRHPVEGEITLCVSAVGSSYYLKR